ncbi:MAG: type II restriction endonuclease [Deltaproteobacteria bacterium]|nr:MAG: type II restriction endonuclease [Deltaproteobacteria bacterium]
MKKYQQIKQKIGSMTAKGGFINEADICNKFNNYKNDLDAQGWLSAMGYDSLRIKGLSAVQIPIRINPAKAESLGVTKEKYDETIKFKKADVQIRVEIIIDDIIHIENISLKKANKSAGFNQVDKRPVLAYKQIWKFDDNIAKWLRLFTGDIFPEKILSREELERIRDKRRLFLNEIPAAELKNIINFFRNNKSLVAFDIIKGRGSLSAEWLLVTRKNHDNSTDWIIKDINSVCNFYSQGEVELSPRGSLKIGRIIMQRKGGTPDPASLQFKINPLTLFTADD